MINKELLKKIALDYGIELTEKQLEQFDIYAETLVEWNSFMNLTAITEPDEIVRKHFVDSLSFFKYADVPQNGKIIDVGTGAGFPGIPILIVRPDVELTLLDSTNKRLEFLKEVLKRTELNAETLHSRAEDAGKSKAYREKFDIATARAVANLRDLSEYCLPFVKKNGYFIPMKSSKAEEEITLAGKAIKVMGGKFEKADTFEIPDVGTRTIVTIRKAAPTPAVYPRPSAKMAKNPIE